MAKTHIHEITQELTSLDLDGSELLVVSNPHGVGLADYETNKLSINSLKDFINDGTSSSFGGYEMPYTEEGDWDGICDTDEKLLAYESSDNNLLYDRGLPLSSTSTKKTLTKKVTRDCAVYFYAPAWDYQETCDITIDGMKIWFSSFSVYSFWHKFYIKKGQTLRAQILTTGGEGSYRISILPLASGGNFFFDVNKQMYKGEKAGVQIGNPYNVSGYWYKDCEWTYTAESDTPRLISIREPIFVNGYGSGSGSGSISSYKIYINDKPWQSMDYYYNGGNTIFLLKPNDTLRIVSSISTEVTSPTQSYISYPLIESDSSSSSESGSETIKNQDKTITSNGVYTADSGFTGLGTVTVNVVNKSNIILGDGTPQTIHNNSNGKLMFNSVDIQTGGNIRVGIQGISTLIGLRYEESQDNVEYWFKPYNDLYLYIAPEGDNYEFQNGQYYWTAGDLIVTNSQDFPTRTNYHGIAFSPKSDLIINITSPTAEGFIVTKQATVANGKWKIT